MNAGPLLFLVLVLGVVGGAGVEGLLSPFYWFWEAVTAGPIQEAQACAIEAMLERASS